MGLRGPRSTGASGSVEPDADGHTWRAPLVPLRGREKQSERSERLVTNVSRQVTSKSYKPSLSDFPLATCAMAPSDARMTHSMTVQAVVSEKYRVEMSSYTRVYCHWAAFVVRLQLKLLFIL